MRDKKLYYVLIIIGIVSIFAYVQIYEIGIFTPQTIRSGWGSAWSNDNQILTITANKTTLSKQYTDPLQNTTQEFPTTDKQWRNLTNLINFEKFNLLPDVIGCPGCGDGPIWWIEISDGFRTKKVTFESLDELSEIKYLALELKIIQSIFHNMNNSSSLIDDATSSCSNIEVYHIPESRVRNQDDFMEFGLTELSQAPLLKNTIDKVNKIEFRLYGHLLVPHITLDELKEYRIFIANKIQSQYPDFTYSIFENGDLYIESIEESFLRDGEFAKDVWINDQLKFLPMTYDGITYDLSKMFHIRNEVSSPRYFVDVLDNYDGKTIIFSESDMKKIPKILESVKIENRQEMATNAQTNVSTSDLSWHFQWFNDKKIGKTGTYIGPDKIHFNDNFYGIRFTVC